MTHQATELTKEQCATALDGMRVFYTLTLAVNDAGQILGTGAYHGDVLAAEPITPVETAELCSDTAMLFSRAAPQLIAFAEQMGGLVEELTEIMEGVEPDNTSPAKDTVATTGQLKQHGTVVH